MLRNADHLANTRPQCETAQPTQPIVRADIDEPVKRPEDWRPSCRTSKSRIDVRPEQVRVNKIDSPLANEPNEATHQPPVEASLGCDHRRQHPASTQRIVYPTGAAYDRDAPKTSASHAVRKRDKHRLGAARASGIDEMHDGWHVEARARLPAGGAAILTGNYRDEYMRRSCLCIKL